MYSPMGLGSLIGLLFVFLVLPCVLASTLPIWARVLVVGGWVLLCAGAGLHWTHQRRSAAD